MAERRMFAKTIVLSDAFLDMPLSARCLYFTLGMFADDDGFVNSPKGIMRQCGASQDDMQVLLSKKFLLAFDDGVIVIKHWRINNYLQKDRYSETKYIDDKAALELDENNAYRFKDGSVYTHSMYTEDVYTQDSIGKDSKGYREYSDTTYPHTLAESHLDDATPLNEEEAPVELIPLSDNSGWRPTMSEYEEFERLYPDVDLEQEFRKMRGWCLSNTRKTRKGIKRFVNNWLSRAQDRTSKNPTGSRSSPYMEAIRDRVSIVDTWG